MHEDSIDALVMIGNSWQLLMTVLFYILSIAVFNFCALSISKVWSTLRSSRGR